MRKLTSHHEAELEAKEIAEWYGDHNPKAAARFSQQLARTTERILENPLQFPVLRRKVRRALVSDFPYAVLFEATDREIRIFAVTHGKRKPNYWLKRKF